MGGRTDPEYRKASLLKIKNRLTKSGEISESWKDQDGDSNVNPATVTWNKTISHSIFDLDQRLKCVFNAYFSLG